MTEKNDKQVTGNGRHASEEILAFPSNPTVDGSSGLLIFDERAGMPLVFRTIRYWEEYLRRLGVKKEFSRALATCSIMSLPLALLGIRQLSAFWAVWLAIFDSLIILLSWRAWDAFMETRSSVIDLLQDVPDGELATLDGSYRKVFRVAPQLCVCGVGAVVSLGADFPTVERVPVTIVSLLVSGFVAGHAFYLIMCTALMARKGSRVSNLRLRWNDPIDVFSATFS